MKVRARRRLAPDARRGELLDAAERALRRKGAACRVEDVVRTARAAKGTFYVYFPSWEDLLLAVRERIYAGFDARFLPAALPADAPAWWTLLERVTEGFVDFTIELGGLHEAIFHGPIAGHLPDAEGGGAQGRLADLIRAGVAAGAFAPVEPVPTARLLFAAIHDATDAIVSGGDRKAYLAAAHRLVRRCLERDEPGRSPTRK